MTEKANVIRSEHRMLHPFARIANAALRDERQCFRARGILAIRQFHSAIRRRSEINHDISKETT